MKKPEAYYYQDTEKDRKFVEWAVETALTNGGPIPLYDESVTFEYVTEKGIEFYRYQFNTYLGCDPDRPAGNMRPFLKERRRALKEMKPGWYVKHYVEAYNCDLFIPVLRSCKVTVKDHNALCRNLWDCLSAFGFLESDLNPFKEKEEVKEATKEEK